MMFVKYFYQVNSRSFLPPIIQCHRGYWIQGITENTLESIKKSYDVGYAMAEFDVRITRDGVVVLFHDKTINSINVADLTYFELSKVTTVNTLDEVLFWYKNMRKTLRGRYNFYLNIEIKTDLVFDRSVERGVLELIQKYGVFDSILISSFNPLALAFFRFKSPKILRSLLLTLNKKESSNNFVVRHQILNFLAAPHCLHLNENDWDKDEFDCLLKRGVPVILWTCNDLDKAKEYLTQGVYGIISDSIAPETIKHVL